MGLKTAFLFPGQGSQSVGMGKDLVEGFSFAKKIFDQVDEICGKPISSICLEGPMAELTVTDNLQPAITAVSICCMLALNDAGIRADISAGHSVGEYPALVSAGIVTSYDALRLAQKRGELMHREALAHPGGMVAVLGMNMEGVEDLVEEAGRKGIIAIANHNTEKQIVITGEKEALSFAVELAKERKAKAIPLKVSGAWHSGLMGGAFRDFREFLEGIEFSVPTGRMLFNATASYEDDPEKIREIMARQLLSPVRWYDIINNMLAEGVRVFIEVGPKKVLSNLVGKIVPPESDVKIFSVGDLKGLNDYLAAAGEF